MLLVTFSIGKGSLGGTYHIEIVNFYTVFIF